MPESAATPDAGTLSGAIFASAPNTVSAIRKAVSPRAATAAGGDGFTIVRSGAVTRIGRKKPALFGIVRSSTERMQAHAVDAVKVSTGVIARFTCGDDPMKSTCIS